MNSNVSKGLRYSGWTVLITGPSARVYDLFRDEPKDIKDWILMEIQRRGQMRLDDVKQAFLRSRYKVVKEFRNGFSNSIFEILDELVASNCIAISEV